MRVAKDSLQTDGQTDGKMDGQTETYGYFLNLKVNPDNHKTDETEFEIKLL